MRLPWISREAHEAEVQLRQNEAYNLRQMLRETEERWQATALAMRTEREAETARTREAHEAIVAEKDARLQDSAEWQMRWQRMYHDMQAERDEWKGRYEVAITPKPEPPAPPPVERKPNIVLDCIRELAQGDIRMTQYLHAEKRRIRKEHPNISDEMLCAELSRWETSDALLDAEVQS